MLLVALVSGCVKDRVIEPSTLNTSPGSLLHAVVVNEIVAKDSQQPNELGSVEDWFEIYNPGDTNITLQQGHWFFSRSVSDPTQYALDRDLTIPAHGFEVIWCDTFTVGTTQIHTGFNLPGSGADVVIHYEDDTTSVEVDSYTYAAQSGGDGAGRVPDGSTHWVAPLTPTPGAPNHP